MPATPDLLRRAIELQAVKHGVDPQLALAVATQESGLDASARGDNGNSLGTFQLQSGAATDTGIAPAQRGDPWLNIVGGVRYLKQQLDKEGGNVDRALSRYNRGTPTYQGIGDPNYVQNVRRHLPGGQSAMASMTQAPPDQAAMTERLRAVQARRQELQGATPGGEPPPPQERPFANEIAQAEAELERARVASPEEAAARVREYQEIFTPYGEERTAANPLPPAPVSDAAAVPYRAPTWGEVGRFATTGRRPVPQILIEKATDPTVEPPLRQAPYAGPPVYGLTEADKQVYDQRVKDAARDAAASLIDVTGEMGGAALGGLATLNPAGAIAGGFAGSVGANELNIALGLRDRSLLGDVVAIGGPLVPAVRPAARWARQRLGPAGRAQRTIDAADEATAAARRGYQASEGERQAAYDARRQVAEQKADDALEAQSTAWTRRREQVEQDYQQELRKWEARRHKASDAEMARVTREQMAYRDGMARADEAERVAMEKYSAAQMAKRDAMAQGQEVSDEALERYAQAQMDARDAQRTFDDAVRAQEGAVDTLRQIPGRYEPSMPRDVPPAPGADVPLPKDVGEGAGVSATLYNRLAAYGDAPVYADLVRDRVAQLLDEIEPLTPLAPSAGKLKTLMQTLKGLDQTDVKTVQNLLKQIRPMTSNANGQVRYAALQAMDMLSEAVEQTARVGIAETAAAGKLMGQARYAFRREKAVQTLRHAFRDAGPIVSRNAQGQPVVNVKAAVNIIDKLVATDRYFAGSFTREELDQLRRDVGAVIGTPDIPKTRPTRPRLEDRPTTREAQVPPEPERPVFQDRPSPPAGPRAIPQEPRPARPAAEPAPQRRQVRMAPYQPKTPPEPVQPEVKPLSLKGLAFPGGISFGMQPIATAATVAGVKAADWLHYTLAQRLLTPEGRAKLARIMSKEGTITPRQMAQLGAGLAIPKATLQAEAREERRKQERRRAERAQELERRQRARRRY